MPAVLIVRGALALAPAREPRYLRPFGVLGEASYRLCLTHLLVASAVARLVGTDSLALVLLLCFLLAAAVASPAST